MSNTVITTKQPQKLGEAIERTLTAIPGAATEAFDKAGKKAGAKAVKRLKATAPKRSGKSAKSWANKKDGGAYVIHSKAPHYRLAHLLEHGHKTRNGGRTRAFNYIAPVEKDAIEEFEAEFEKNIEEKLQEIAKK